MTDGLRAMCIVELALGFGVILTVCVLLASAAWIDGVGQTTSGLQFRTDQYIPPVVLQPTVCQK